MDNERRKKLNDTLKKFNKKHKTEVFTLGSEIKELPVIPSGVKKIDDFLGGGFKRGGHTIVWGVYSSGKTALVLQTLANAQKMGLFVCFVNSEKPIDPSRFEFFGINLEEMVYIEAPEHAEQALEGMRSLCRDKVIDLFIVDSTNGLGPKNKQYTAKGQERALEKKNVATTALMLSEFYNTVNPHVFRSKASVIWIGQGRVQGIGSFFVRMGLSCGEAQKFYAYQIISTRLGQGSDAPVQKFKEYFVDPDGKVRFSTVDEKIGFDVVLKMEKTNSSRSVKKGQDLHVAYLDNKGFVDFVKNDEILVRIDSEMNDEEKKVIENHLIEKKPEEAQQLGLIGCDISDGKDETVISEINKDGLKEKPKRKAKRKTKT